MFYGHCVPEDFFWSVIFLPKIRFQTSEREGAAITINKGSSGYLYLIEPIVII